MNKTAYNIIKALLMLLTFALVSFAIGTDALRGGKPVKTWPVALNAIQDGDDISVGTNLVSVNVAVIDTKGKPVTGLSRDQFELFDDNEKQQIAFFSAEQAPTTFGMVYDMHPTTVERTTATLRALRQFVRTIRPVDSFFIVLFNERGSLVLDFVPTYEQVHTNLSIGTSGVPASLYDAVYLAAGKVRESKNPKRALLVISDGEDHHSKSSYRELSERIRGFDVQIYSIGINGAAKEAAPAADRWAFEDITNRTGLRSLLDDADAPLGKAVLDELAKVSGGTSYFPESAGERELAGICVQIALELRQQYSIGFYPTDITSRAKWHALQIRVTPAATTKTRFSLSYRSGYHAFENEKRK